MIVELYIEERLESGFLYFGVHEGLKGFCDCRVIDAKVFRFRFRVLPPSRTITIKSGFNSLPSRDLEYQRAASIIEMAGASEKNILEKCKSSTPPRLELASRREAYETILLAIPRMGTRRFLAPSVTRHTIPLDHAKFLMLDGCLYKPDLYTSTPMHLMVTRHTHTALDHTAANRAGQERCRQQSSFDKLPHPICNSSPPPR
jgi:hypothetical protein